MSSIVLDLQKHILESDKPISNLLHTALVIARKLELEEIGEWIEQELNGYPNIRAIPLYRDVSGDPVALNKFGQWQKIWVYNLDEETLRQISTFHIDYPIEQIENSVNLNVPAFVITYDEDAQKMLTNAMNIRGIPGVQIDSSKFRSILNAIKKILLEWTLELEIKGVLGENMIFSDNEKQLARTSSVKVSALLHKSL